MAIAKTILVKLGLNEEADESAVLAAIERLKSSSYVSNEVEKILGLSGMEAIGAVRALKETKERVSTLQAEVAQVRTMQARATFDALIQEGRSAKNRKLSPVAVKEFSKKFEDALASGSDGSAVVEELKGFLKLAAPIGAVPVGPARVTSAGAELDALMWEGKTYAQLDAGEKHMLKRRDPELFKLMRDEHLAQTNH